MSHQYRVMTIYRSDGLCCKIWCTYCHCQFMCYMLT
ncbi:unnamed protein product [Gongylonema pulchrum]|uniref:Uncharacterized protein n=1 Tax=Gongylonema pulchrum TaxID=637853 RepID=A0A3P7P348_9BILA|nr:unnamed protein product [Gongylonema pulchrum]